MGKIDLLGDGLDGGRVMAWMTFPSDEALREHQFVRGVIEHSYADGRAPDEMVSVPVWALQKILEGPSAQEMRDSVANATKQGTVAGDLLAMIYEMHLRGVDEPSFGKAIEQYKAYALPRKYGDGDALKRSEQTLRNYFEAFAPVAHLWAAFRLNQGPYAFTHDQRDVFNNYEALKALLGVAKSIGEFASSFVPKRTKPPLPVIDGSVMVKIPDEIPAMRLVFKPIDG